MILALYHQYDGYETGVGNQLRELVWGYELINGITYDERNKVANGFRDLALMYLLENKDGVGGIYATTPDNSQEYDYKVYARYNKDIGVDEIYKIFVINNYEENKFEGTKQDFNDYILDCFENE